MLLDGDFAGWIKVFPVKAQTMYCRRIISAARKQNIAFELAFSGGSDHRQPVANICDLIILIDVLVFAITQGTLGWIIKN